MPPRICLASSRLSHCSRGHCSAFGNRYQWRASKAFSMSTFSMSFVDRSPAPLSRKAYIFMSSFCCWCNGLSWCLDICQVQPQVVIQFKIFLFLYFITSTEIRTPSNRVSQYFFHCLNHFKYYLNCHLSVSYPNVFFLGSYCKRMSKALGTEEWHIWQSSLERNLTVRILDAP